MKGSFLENALGLIIGVPAIFAAAGVFILIFISIIMWIGGGVGGGPSASSSSNSSTQPSVHGHPLEPEPDRRRAEPPRSRIR
jgi:hypothetical protein